MNHEQLWAPWRLGYIKGEDKPRPAASDKLNWLPGADQECFICRGLVEQTDRENLIVHRGDEAVIVLNRYPYNNGHLLIAPQRHLAKLADLTTGEHAEIMRLASEMTTLLERLMNAEGFNIGLNLGRAAGAGLPGHLHWHIVPRWNGDTNFMPTLAGVKSIPQSLDSLWRMLVDALAAENT